VKKKPMRLGLEMKIENPEIQPIVFGVSFVQSQISIDDLVLLVSVAKLHEKETNEIEIGDED